MIGILEDRKGFKKEVYLSHPYPIFQVSEWKEMNVMMNDGQRPEIPTQVTNHIFYRCGDPINVHGTPVIHYKEQ